MHNGSAISPCRVNYFEALEGFLSRQCGLLYTNMIGDEGLID